MEPGRNIGGKPVHTQGTRVDAKRRRVKSAAMSSLLVLTNLPDADSAHALAVLLVEQRLAACVNILAPARSVYRWAGKITDADEVPLLIKTSTARYAELEEAIRNHHPYELPEIIAVPIEQGLPAYLAWVDAETTATNFSC